MLRDSSPKPAPDTVAVLIVPALLTAISVNAVASAWLNHDVGWYLHMAGAWVDGAVMYQDVIDTNPPLIVWLTALPVLLGRLLHLPLPVTFKALMFAAALGSIGAGAAIVRRLVATVGPRAVVISVFAFLLLSFVRSDFGQREHLAVVLVAPYVFASAARIAGRALTGRHESLSGILAGLGFALKPHFLLAWALLEVWTALAGPRSQRLRLRPGALSVAGTLLLYGLLVVVLFPQYGTIAAEVVRVYGGLNATSTQLLGLPELRVWLLGLATVILVRLPPERAKVCLTIFVTATGFLVAALAQQKGWAYHLYPFNVFAGLHFALVFAAMLESHAAVAAVGRTGRRLVLAGVLVALVVTAWRYGLQTSAPSGVQQVEALHALVERERAESLAVLSMRTILFPAFPVVNYTGSAWVMRHHSLWFLPGLYATELAGASGRIPHRGVAAMDPLEQQYFGQIVDDLCARPPRMLVVEPPLEAGRGPGSLDLVAYYSQDGRFARLFAGYDRRGAFGPFVAYVRSGEGSCEPG